MQKNATPKLTFDEDRYIYILSMMEETFAPRYCMLTLGDSDSCILLDQLFKKEERNNTFRIVEETFNYTAL